MTIPMSTFGIGYCICTRGKRQPRQTHPQPDKQSSYHRLGDHMGLSPDYSEGGGYPQTQGQREDEIIEVRNIMHPWSDSHESHGKVTEQEATSHGDEGSQHCLHGFEHLYSCHILCALL